MSQDIQPLLKQLDRLGASHGKLETLTANIKELQARLDATQEATLRLDTLSKDYDSNLNRLSNVTGALTIQLEQAEQALAAEIFRVKADAVHTDQSAGQFRSRLKACDEDILASLLLVWRKVIARKRLAEEHIENNGLLARLSMDAGCTFNAVAPTTPWHTGSLPNDAEEAAAWLERFADRAKRKSQLPEEPAALVEWFSSRR